MLNFIFSFDSTFYLSHATRAPCHLGTGATSHALPHRSLTWRSDSTSCQAVPEPPGLPNTHPPPPTGRPHKRMVITIRLSLLQLMPGGLTWLHFRYPCQRPMGLDKNYF